MGNTRLEGIGVKLTKIRMLVELEYDGETMHGDDEDAICWFFYDILKKEVLTLHSNEIGDEIGTVKVLEFRPTVDDSWKDSKLT